MVSSMIMIIVYHSVGRIGPDHVINNSMDIGSLLLHLWVEIVRHMYWLTDTCCRPNQQDQVIPVSDKMAHFVFIIIH